jgi:hypothetical protein
MFFFFLEISQELDDKTEEIRKLAHDALKRLKSR